ncbi:MAG: metallophosphoesterase [Ruminococcus sp.]|nr:metallophosphoesterase [Ruminococcus sp.]
MRKARITAAAAAVMMVVLCVPLGASAASGAHFTLVDAESEGSSTIDIGGEKWFKVKDFADDKDYVITVKNSEGEQLAVTVADDEKSGSVWHYFRQTMVASTTPRFTTLTSGKYYLVCSGDKLRTAYTRSVSGDLVWEHAGSALRYTEGNDYYYLKYDEDSDEPLSVTTELSEAAEVSIYTNGEQLERCIIEQPHAESYVIEGSGYSAPVFTVGLAGVDVDSVSWYVDGERQNCAELSFAAETLRDRSAGVHRVSCLVEAHDGDGVRYRERSEDALFVIAKGVVPDSVLTFSDVHEEYGLIGDAIGKVIERTDGYIPSLIVCTGDLVNGPKADTDTMLGRYYPRIIAELGGLDTVFASGNHDDGMAASFMSAEAGLGAGEPSAAGGVIFRGSSEAAARNGKNSLSAKGVIVYGLNQEAVILPKDGTTAYTYEDVLGDLEAFLRETAEDYSGELVIISAHTGLHTLGVQSDSVNSKGVRLTDWVGDNPYNIDRSYDLAALINSFAEQYGMDILYLFGHDHSRGETEFVMKRGSELISTQSYSERTTGSQKLGFTYAHSGYLSTVIGSADSNFSFIYRDGNGFAYDLIRTFDGSVRHTDIEARFVPAETTAAMTSTAKASTATTSAASAGKTESPKTGDSMNAGLLLLPTALLLLTIKKKALSL